MSTDRDGDKESTSSMFRRVSSRHMEDWVKNQKELLQDWRKLIEERSKNDSELLSQLTKSYMTTGFKMLELQKKSLDMAHKAHLDQLDEYLKYLDSRPIPDGSSGAKPAGSAKRRKP